MSVFDSAANAEPQRSMGRGEKRNGLGCPVADRNPVHDGREGLSSFFLIQTETNVVGGQGEDECPPTLPAPSQGLTGRSRKHFLLVLVWLKGLVGMQESSGEE